MSVLHSSFVVSSQKKVHVDPPTQLPWQSRGELPQVARWRWSSVLLPSELGQGGQNLGLLQPSFPLPLGKSGHTNT